MPYDDAGDEVRSCLAHRQALTTGMMLMLGMPGCKLVSVTMEWSALVATENVGIAWESNSH